MAEVIWTEPALRDLEAIADYIAIDSPEAAAGVVRRVYAHVAQLAEHPRSGRRVPELKRSRYREIVEPPCRIFYRIDDERVFVVHVMRAERLLRSEKLRGPA
jgi:toxin ParE1/3/4